LSSGFLADARRALASGLGWAGLPGDALAAVLADVAADGRWLVVVDGQDAAERLIGGLRFFHPRPERILAWPPDDVRPYDGFSTHPDLPVTRLATLRKVEDGGPCLVIAAAPALLARVPDAATRARGTKVLARGDVLDRDVFVRFLQDGGYVAAGRVAEPGSYAVRGDVVDLWPAGGLPVRVDWFDDTIEDVRKLDPGSLRTTGRAAQRVIVLPVREERLDRPAIERLGVELGRLVASQKRGLGIRRRVWEELNAGIRFAGLEAWLPALVPTVAPLDALAGLKMIAVHPDELALTLRDLERSTRERYAALDEDERPLVPPTERYVPADDVIAAIHAAHPVMEIPIAGKAVDLGARPVDGYLVKAADLAPVVGKLKELARKGVKVALVADDGKRAEQLLEMLEPHGLDPTTRSSPGDVGFGEIALLVGELRRGFVAADSKLAFIPVSALFGERARSQRFEKAHAFFDASVGHVSELREGDLVVHRIHGVGLYKGLVRVPITVDPGRTSNAPRLQGEGGIADVAQDFVRVEYRNGDLLMLPVTRLEQLSRYTAAHEGAAPTLDKLGGVTWAAKRAKVRDSVLKMANELLGIYAKRELADRPAYDPPGSMYRAFEARFPYDETPDQGAAIDAVNDDLSKDSPMDRLVCGDVGYGKTEVAMRAAMRAVENGKQVLVLCPTTVLAFQHFQKFRERFEGLPVTVEMLSRFRTAAQERDILEALREGRIDVVIGTTRLLGRGVKLPKLGLVVIDEEHRFGVTQKERLKKMRASVDVLSMSATPIPRTLQMGLSGMREMSIMATPPRDRLAVRTTVGAYEKRRVRDAIVFELERKGQVFFVHNRIEDIHEVAADVEKWVPEARVGVVHGQMDAEKLEDVLIEFIEQRLDVLVSSAIIESGVDLPNVNTMLINRADRFGLAQLYQLRGRVGRGSARASCILLVPEDLSADAKRRIRTLCENTDLGAGFKVAMADLEIRGAGNLLGDAQSGNIDSVGYEAWLEILEDAVHQARGELDVARVDPEVEVPVKAFLPESMFPDVQERLGRYRDLAAIATEAGVDAWIAELEDRFGADNLPVEVHNLAGLTRTRVVCRSLGIVRCAWLKVRVTLELHAKSRIKAETLKALVIAGPKRWAVREQDDGTRVVEVRFLPQEAEYPFRFLRWALAQLAA
jgi:transcription-repair coupling factor (superfamily II helicase)